MSNSHTEQPNLESEKDKNDIPDNKIDKAQKIVEIGGPAGPEPTRYGDWERNGRVSDF